MNFHFASGCCKHEFFEKKPTIDALLATLNLSQSVGQRASTFLGWPVLIPCISYGEPWFIPGTQGSKGLCFSIYRFFMWILGNLLENITGKLYPPINKQFFSKRTPSQLFLFLWRELMTPKSSEKKGCLRRNAEKTSFFSQNSAILEFLLSKCCSLIGRYVKAILRNMKFMMFLPPKLLPYMYGAQCSTSQLATAYRSAPDRCWTSLNLRFMNAEFLIC